MYLYKHNLKNKMKETLIKATNWFYKDSRLTIVREKDQPDGGLKKKIEVNMLTLNPYDTKTTILNKGDSIDMTGSYGLSPLDIFNPFKERQNLAWLMMYQQGLLSDVNAEIIHPQFGSIMVTVNNPQIGTPYIVFYNDPALMVLGSIAGTRFNLSENESGYWASDKGWVIRYSRNKDTDNKEFSVLIK
jgi:hypothetical protein